VETAPAAIAPVETAPAAIAPVETAPVVIAPVAIAPAVTARVATDGAEPTAVAEPAPPSGGVLLAEDVLERSDREAAEAVKSGAFNDGQDTVRVRRDAVAVVGVPTPAPPPSTETPPAAPEKHESGEAAPAKPAEALESPLAAVKAAVSAESSAPAAVAVSSSESAAPAAPVAPPLVGVAVLPPVDERAPTEKFPRTPPSDVSSEKDEETERWERPEVPGVPASAALDAMTATTVDEIPAVAAGDATKSGATLKARSEEDDRLLGALIFVEAPLETGGPDRGPSPFATIAGVTLVRRAAAAARAAQVPRVVLAGPDPEMVERATVEFVSAGFTGQIETWSPAQPLPFAERGRILILDAAGVHDPDAVARLARWRGERACIIVAPEGDGLRVQVENGKVREVGSQLVPFDGVTCGAVNVPLPLFPRLTERGALGALVSLAHEGLLAASLERRTFAREINSETGLSEARQRLLERASGGGQDALLNRLVHRRLSRPLTAVLLPMGVSPSVLTIAGGLTGILGAALLSGCGMIPTPIVLLLGVLLLFSSIILDCAGNELAALGMTDSGSRRSLALVLDGAVSAAAVVGLGAGARMLKVEDGLTYGAFAALGIAMAAILTIFVSRRDAPPSNDPVSRGVELLAARIRNRDITYLILVIVLGHTIQSLVQPEGEAFVLWLSLVVLPALAHAYWVALAALIALRPPAA
jgi:hypothetical protein